MRLNYLLLLILLLNACHGVPTSVNGHNFIQKTGRTAEKKWTLVWQDNFDKQHLDTTKWTMIPPGKADWGKHMSNNPSCFRFDNGYIYLRGINNPDTTTDHRPFLTGGIYTKGKFAFQYGKIEIRAKLEGARGAWPAMWMLAEKTNTANIPKTEKLILWST